jgi:hypothetical protein
MCIYCGRVFVCPGARTADRQAAIAFCGEWNVPPNRTCVGLGLGLGLEGGMREGPGCRAYISWRDELSK